MPRRSSGPRLYLDPERQSWAVRDGNRFLRTGCVAGNRADAEKWLHAYIGRKHAPTPHGNPLIAEVLTVYGTEHAPHTARPKDMGYYIGNLIPFWENKRASEITAKTCRDYAATKRGARRDLEVLRAAIRYWHKNYGPLLAVPVFTLPKKGQPRERWLTRSEVARLLWAARHTEHLKRFILIALHTGSRAGVMFALRWDWIDLDRGIMRRRGPGEADKANKRRPPVKLRRSLVAFLRRWKRLDGDASAFVVNFGGYAIKSHIRRAWLSACVAAELPGITPHVLRHTKATWLMQQGAPIWKAANFLGMTVAMLEGVYGHHAIAFQDDVVEL